MEPLAVKIRPQNLYEFVGQEHLVGKDKPLRIAIEQKHVMPFILWGPPGVGKTTLARIYAGALGADFFELSAVSAGKDDIRNIVISNKKQVTSGNKSKQQGLGLSRHSEPFNSAQGKLREESDKRSFTNVQDDQAKPKVLFLDEIHRFNKAQQDYLLPFVESGELILIGATTENPSFEVIPALLSRCRVFVLSELSDEEMRTIIKNALNYLTRPSTVARGTLSSQGEGKKSSKVSHPSPAPTIKSGSRPGSVGKEERGRGEVDQAARDWLISMANGDARQAISMIENTASLYDQITIETLKETLQSKHLRYDKKGEEHYNTISAFIKSMRASQIDAALYYLARMIDSSEDPKFIARRMVVFASEDIGLAQPTALVVANAVFRACETIGLPECQINLAHGVSYLCQCKKDRSSYEAYFEALADVKEHGNLPIPMNIRNAPTKLMKELGYGKGYQKYDDETYLPDKLKKKKYYRGS